MKKHKFFNIFWLLTLFSVILTGCGGGGGGGGSSKSGAIYFAMPSYYYDPSSGQAYAIPSGKTVNFYISMNDSAPISADHVVTGTTGEGVIKVTLPGSLKNQQRFIYAVVDLDGSDGSFDLQGKTEQQLQESVILRDILFGQVVDPEDPDGQKILVTLIDGITIDDFKFIGIPAEGEPAVSLISFTIPSKYLGPAPEEEDNPEYDMPMGKTIKFYAITQDDYTNASGGAPISAQHILTGATGGRLEVQLPDSLKGASRHFIAIVLIKGAFDDLQGKTVAELAAAMNNGEVLYGKSLKPDSGEIELYQLNEGVNNIGNFEFLGM